MTYTYYCPPGSQVKLVNPDWTGREATVTFHNMRNNISSGTLLDRAEHARAAHAQLERIESTLPLVVEWYLRVDGFWYSSTAATSLLDGIHAGRWALGGEWADSRVLTIQDRSSKEADPGFSNRPLLVFDASGIGLGPSQVMEVGSMTIHDLSEWRYPGGPAIGQRENTGSWIMDFEWAPGAAWSLVRHNAGTTDTKKATHVERWAHWQTT